MLVKKSLDLKPPGKKYYFIPILLLICFVTLYPLALSIYVFPPLFIGTMAYVFLEGLDREKYLAIFVALVYFINLEVNLSLPLFFIIIVSLMFYVVFYPMLDEIKKCTYCKGIISVIAINFMYLFGLSIYDFIFSTNTFELSEMLFYSLLVDMLLVMVL